MYSTQMTINFGRSCPIKACNVRNCIFASKLSKTTPIPCWKCQMEQFSTGGSRCISKSAILLLGDILSSRMSGQNDLSAFWQIEFRHCYVTWHGQGTDTSQVIGKGTDFGTDPESFSAWNLMKRHENYCFSAYVTGDFVCWPVPRMQIAGAGTGGIGAKCKIYIKYWLLTKHPRFLDILKSWRRVRYANSLRAKVVWHRNSSQKLCNNEASVLSETKPWSQINKGKNGRDLSSELPFQSMWLQCGNLRLDNLL